MLRPRLAGLLLLLVPFGSLAGRAEAQLASKENLPVPDPASPEAVEGRRVEDAVTVAAAPGEGVTVRAGEDFQLNLRARIQLRGEVLEVSDDDTAPLTNLFIRRMRLALKGHAFDPSLTYTIQLAFAPLDLDPVAPTPLRDAYVNWAAHRDLEVRAGQMKIPFGRQRVTSSSALEFVDRSIITGELNLDRDVGVQVHSADLFGLGGTLGYHLGVFSGDGRNRVGDRFGLLYVARLVVSPLGPIEVLDEGDLGWHKAPRFAVGFTGAFNQNTDRHRSTIGPVYSLGDFDYSHGAADVVFRWYGFSFQSEAYVRYTRQEALIATVDGAEVTEFSRSAWGAFAQASQLLTRHWGVAARYGYLRPFAGRDPGYLRRQELGLGVNYFFSDHDLKLQVDYFHLGDTLFARGSEHMARLQLQLYF